MLLALWVLLIGPTSAQANAALSRKYNMPCERCHSMIPRLNVFGYAFYRAGFRLPGPNKPMTLANSTTLISDVTLGHAEPGSTDTLTDDKIKLGFVGTLSNQVTLRAAYLTSLRETVRSGFGQLWLQYNSAPSGKYWSVRVGQMPILDGYNLLGNREISLTDPQGLRHFGPLTSSLNLGDVERGIQIARTSGPLSVRLSWLNGVNSAGKGGVSLPGNRFHDFLLQSDYMIGKDGSMIGAFGYLGKTPLEAQGFTNNFQRVGLTGTWAKVLRPGKMGVPGMLLEVNSALVWGEDAVSATGARANSLAAILEADLYLHNRTAFFVRYDGGKSPTTDSTPTSDAFTVGASHRFTRNVQAELEYRNKRDTYGSTVLLGLNLSL
ncbi:MAG: uncharacterized protein JWL77_2456 [Chthonomonadaceae bacterium]|nr:uncharacterized protein [Chthonomonadaceae bacterium]